MKNLLKIFLLVFCSFNFLSAQIFDFRQLPSEKNQFEFMFTKPFIKGDVDMSFLSGIYQISANIPVSSKLNIIGEIPFIYTNYEVNSFFLGNYKYEESGFANIFIGLQTKPSAENDKRSAISFGLYLPTADERIAFQGAVADYYEFQKYLPNTLGLYFNYAYHKSYPNGLRFGFEVGPNISIPTEGNRSGDMLLHYGITGGVEINKMLLINIELGGVAIVTESVDNFSDRFIHLMNFGAAWTEGKVIPKIFYKIYLDDIFSEAISGSLGIGVSMSLD